MSDRVGVGLLGYGFMGRAHAHALHTLAHMIWPPPLACELVAIAGRDREAVETAARRFGFVEAVSDWRALVADERIDLFDNVGPNALHTEPTVAAAEAGKHVLCEKPLARNADEAFEVWRRVAAARVKHQCGFNYRFVPAVRLANQMIEAGTLGEIYHFRASYLQEWLLDPAAPMTWRLDRAQAGSGAVGDLGAHIIDLGRYLVGEITAVNAETRTFIHVRDGRQVTVDDAFSATVLFDNGAQGTLEASRFAAGRKNALTWEINGSSGSLAFDLERLNELRVCEGTRGFKTVLVTEAADPFVEHWWPPGHVLGWEHTFTHQFRHLLEAIRDDHDVGPHGATFADGYRAAAVCDAILRSADEGGRIAISYRDLPTTPCQA
jgi:predicted dehydrogenase